MRYLIFFGFLALIFFIQRFWFASAWHRIEIVSNPVARYSLQFVWIAGLALVLSNFLGPLIGRLLPRGPLGAWMIGASRVWLVASIVGFFTYYLVSGVG